MSKIFVALSVVQGGFGGMESATRALARFSGTFVATVASVSQIPNLNNCGKNIFGSK
jgi:hypothetical protein